MLHDKFQEWVTQGTEMSHGEVVIPNLLDRLMRGNLRMAPREKVVNPLLNVQDIGSGKEQFSPPS